MGIFDRIRKLHKSVFPESVKTETDKQVFLSRKVLSILHDRGTKPDAKQKVEYFFYADKEDNANNIAIELSRLGYQIDIVDRSAPDDSKWLINGWTSEMAMDDKTLTDWTTLMCKLAEENNCEFDGWGTYVELE